VFEVEGDGHLGDGGAEVRALQALGEVRAVGAVRLQDDRLHPGVELELDVGQPAAAQVAVTHDGRSGRVRGARHAARVDLRGHVVGVRCSKVVAKFMSNHNQVPGVKFSV
jgi:hypothetical protein